MYVFNVLNVLNVTDDLGTVHWFFCICMVKRRIRDHDVETMYACHHHHDDGSACARLRSSFSTAFAFSAHTCSKHLPRWDMRRGVRTGAVQAPRYGCVHTVREWILLDNLQRGAVQQAYHLRCGISKLERKRYRLHRSTNEHSLRAMPRRGIHITGKQQSPGYMLRLDHQQVPSGNQ